MSFCTVINCMDGRTQLSVNKYLQKKYDVAYVDTITEPGPIKILADNSDRTALESIFRRIDISVLRHGSKAIAVVGHHDCAGNPVDKETQLEQIKKSIRLLKQKYPNCDFSGLWVNEEWETEEISL